MVSLPEAGTQHLQSLGFRLPSAPSVGESSLASGKLATQAQQQCTGLPLQQELQTHNMSPEPDADQADLHEVQSHKGSGQAALRKHEVRQGSSQATRQEQQLQQVSQDGVEVISSDDGLQGCAKSPQVGEPEEPFNPAFSGAFGQPMICRFCDVQA